MPIFSIYQYELKEGEAGPSLFPELGEEANAEKRSAYATREEYFASFFTPKRILPLHARKKAKKETEEYRAEILAHFDGIILLTIENNKSKQTIENKKEVKHPHHPFCHIAIDSRKGHQWLAIERSSAFDSNTETICKILCEGMNYKMHPANVQMCYKEKYKSKNEFWKTVSDIKTLFDDSVKQIRLDFNQKKAKNYKPNPCDMMGAVTAMAMKMQTNSAILFGTGANEDVKLDEVREDLTNIADICMKQKEYDLVVKFKKFGLYKYGADIKAQFGVDDSVISDFAQGKKEIEEGNPDGTFGLMQWLERINKLMEEYEDATPILQRRLRSRRR